MVALTIGLTMACTVVIAKVVGCTLPLCAKKVGLDRPIMATPLISTLVDISTISVYFAIVSKHFNCDIFHFVPKNRHKFPIRDLVCKVSLYYN